VQYDSLTTLLQPFLRDVRGTVKKAKIMWGYLCDISTVRRLRGPNALTNKTPIIRAEIPNQSAFLSIPRLLSISNGVYDFLVGIYRQKTRALPTVDYTELLKKYERKPLHPNFEQRFSLLSYIRENWIWHTMSYDKSFAKKWDQFKDLALYKNLLFESRPWGVSQQPSNLPHLRLFVWAVENSHIPLLDLLKELESFKPYIDFLGLFDESTTPLGDAVMRKTRMLFLS